MRRSAPPMAWRWGEVVGLPLHPTRTRSLSRERGGRGRYSSTSTVVGITWTCLLKSLAYPARYSFPTVVAAAPATMSPTASGRFSRATRALASLVPPRKMASSKSNTTGTRRSRRASSTGGPSTKAPRYTNTTSAPFATWAWTRRRASAPAVWAAFLAVPPGSYRRA